MYYIKIFCVHLTWILRHSIANVFIQNGILKHKPSNQDYQKARQTNNTDRLRVEMAKVLKRDIDVEELDIYVFQKQS